MMEDEEGLRGERSTVVMKEGGGMVVVDDEERGGEEDKQAVKHWSPSLLCFSSLESYQLRLPCQNASLIRFKGMAP